MYLIYRGSANQKIPYRFMLGTFLSEDIIVQQLHIQFLSCYPLFIEIYTFPCRLFIGDRLHHWWGGGGRIGNALEDSLSYWSFSLHLLFLCGRWFYLWHLPTLPFTFGFFWFFASLLPSHTLGLDLSSLSNQKQTKASFLVWNFAVSSDLVFHPPV